MNREIFSLIKKESKYIGIILAAALIIIQAIYYKEDFSVVLKIAISLFWLFAVPGYFATLYWHDQLEFAERFVVGILLSAAIIGIFSYYLGLIGLNMKYHAFILPPTIVIIGLMLSIKKKSSSS